MRLFMRNNVWRVRAHAPEEPKHKVISRMAAIGNLLAGDCQKPKAKKDEDDGDEKKEHWSAERERCGLENTNVAELRT